MIKRKVFVLIFGALCFVSADNEVETNFTFVGFDGQTPVFTSITGTDKSAIHKIINGQSTQMTNFGPSGSKLVCIHNSIYVFNKRLNDGSGRYHLKLKNGKTIAEFSAEHVEKYFQGYIVMNDDYIFITINNENVQRIRYRPEIKIDTIKTGKNFITLYGVDNNYLYFADENDEPADYGNMYQMDINSGETKMLLKNLNKFKIAMAIPLNLIYYCDNFIFDYKKNIITRTSGNCGSLNKRFFSYEHNAFIFYKYIDYGPDVDVNKWSILRLNDFSEWTPFNDGERRNIPSKQTDPQRVFFTNRCNERCTTGVAQAYRERTGCIDLFGLSGNQIFDYLVKSSKEPSPKFKEVAIDETVSLEYDGHFIIAAHKDPKEHGHITIVQSGIHRDDYWQIDWNKRTYLTLPCVKDTGLKKPVKNQRIDESYDSRMQMGVKFFLYTGNGCKKQ